MLEWVWNAAAAPGSGLEHLVLATPDEELLRFGRDRGWPTVKTSDRYKRCMDCVAEAAEALVSKDEPGDETIVINVQSDEPCLTTEEIWQFIQAQSNWITVMARPISDAERSDPNVVKMLVGPGPWMTGSTRKPVPVNLRIAGVFALTYGQLAWFAGLPESSREAAEQCDINRVIDDDDQPFVHVCPVAAPSVDVPADIARVETYLKVQHVNN